jgi:hypothetical protein
VENIICRNLMFSAAIPPSKPGSLQVAHGPECPDKIPERLEVEPGRFVRCPIWKKEQILPH